MASLQQYEVHEEQNLLDVALGVYGTLDLLDLLLTDNPGLTPDSELESGDKLWIRRERPAGADTEVLERWQADDNYQPATGGNDPGGIEYRKVRPDTTTPKDAGLYLEVGPKTGIGHMQIGNDFHVSELPNLRS